MWKVEGDSGVHQAFGTLVTKGFSLPLQSSVGQKQQLVLYGSLAQEGTRERIAQLWGKYLSVCIQCTEN